MPVGAIIDSIGTLLGGLLGGLIGSKLSDKFKDELNYIIAAWAMSLGIALIPKVGILGPVVISLVLSYIVGFVLDFDGHVNSLVLKVSKKIFGNSSFDIEKLSVFIVLTAFGGSGIVGSMTEAISGDNSIIIARAVCNTITAIMFAASVGPIISIASIFGLISLSLFFYCAKLIMPLMTEMVYANFIATGGILTLLSSLKLFGISKAKPMNAILCIFIVVPITMLWTSIM